MVINKKNEKSSEILLMPSCRKGKHVHCSRHMRRRKIWETSPRFMNGALELVSFPLRCANTEWTHQHIETFCYAQQLVHSFISTCFSLRFDLFVATRTNFIFLFVDRKSEKIFSHFSRTVKWSSRNRKENRKNLDCYN